MLALAFCIPATTFTLDDCLDLLGDLPEGSSAHSDPWFIVGDRCEAETPAGRTVSDTEFSWYAVVILLTVPSGAFFAVAGLAGTVPWRRAFLRAALLAAVFLLATAAWFA